MGCTGAQGGIKERDKKQGNGAEQRWYHCRSPGVDTSPSIPLSLEPRGVGL